MVSDGYCKVKLDCFMSSIAHCMAGIKYFIVGVDYGTARVR